MARDEPLHRFRDWEGLEDKKVSVEMKVARKMDAGREFESLEVTIKMNLQGRFFD